jgi:hypothetical protein
MLNQGLMPAKLLPRLAAVAILIGLAGACGDSEPEGPPSARTPISGDLVVSTLARDLEFTEGFGIIRGIALDDKGDIYTSGYLAHQIIRLDSEGNLTIFVGAATAGFADGKGQAARFAQPQGIEMGREAISMSPTPTTIAYVL